LIDPWSARRPTNDGAAARLIRAIVPARFRPIRYLENLVRRRTGDQVARGPFSGMHYIAGAANSAYVPKLLGIYERELNECIEEACRLNFAQIVDIGAAEGYYAVGLARRNPRARVIAFEREPKGQNALKRMAALNNVAEQLEIRGKCGVADLRLSLQNSDLSLVVCDVEGDEEILLDPATVPELRRAHLLVEMHDFIHPGITERMVQRFEATHEVERIWQEPRSRTEMPWRTLGTALMPRRYLDWAVSEWRPVQMSWLRMEPRNGFVQ
jgi:predicted O-methyltransferase YrrM